MGYLADDSFSAYFIRVSGAEDVARLRARWPDTLHAVGASFARCAFEQPASTYLISDGIPESLGEVVLLFVDDQNFYYAHGLDDQPARTLEYSEGRWSEPEGLAEAWEARAGVGATDFDPFAAAARIAEHFGFEAELKG